jgi:hypothetical protein
MAATSIELYGRTRVRLPRWSLQLADSRHRSRLIIADIGYVLESVEVLTSTSKVYKFVTFKRLTFCESFCLCLNTEVIITILIKPSVCEGDVFRSVLSKADVVGELARTRDLAWAEETGSASAPLFGPSLNKR